jgi:DNA-binding transcriptional MerR regulator
MNYNAEQAACISGCTIRQLRYWRDTGLIQPACVMRGENAPSNERYDFLNLVELRTIMGMLKEGISLQKIRKTLAFLRRNRDTIRPLAQCKLVTDGSTIFEICDNPQGILDTLREGQTALCIALDGIIEELESRLIDFDRDRQSFLHHLTG